MQPNLNTTGTRTPRTAAALVMLAVGALLSMVAAQETGAQAPVGSYPSSVDTPTSTLTPTGTATYGPYCQVVIHDSITLNDPQLAGILVADGTPSVCQWDPPTCPGVADTTPRHYKLYRFLNPYQSFSFQCLNIRIEATDCAGNIVAFSGGIADLCTGYLGDAGGPIEDTASFEVGVHRGQYISFIVSEVEPNSGCGGYTFTITPQYNCLTSPTPTITPSPTYTAIPTSTATSTATRTLTHIPVSTATPPPTSTVVTNSPTPGSSVPPSTATAQVTTTPSVTLTPQRTATTIPTSSATTTSIATVCTINFSDVPAGSTFYPFVRCLACLGIVQGYGDGTYRPADPVTRGQASKIIANAAGWADAIPLDRQTFSDVTYGSTFWVYIERMYLHEAIDGYTCGRPGEPCPGVYYRPGNTLTRGQIAKITSISAGYDDVIPPDRQTFSDVEPDGTFWVYIERVYLHGVVSGYADGTYRPQNTVTRGQIAKVAANTFYADCDTP